MKDNQLEQMKKMLIDSVKACKTKKDMSEWILNTTRAGIKTIEKAKVKHGR